jgi:hypothetical protein
LADAVCKKHMKWGDKFGNSAELQPGGPMQAFWEACEDGEGLLICQPALDALGGKVDAGIQALIPDYFHYTGLKDSDGKLTPEGYCIKRVARIRNNYLGPVIFALDNAKDLLLGMVDSPDKLKDVMCRDKAEVARALWYLGDKSAADGLIATFDNAECTGDHIRNTLPVLHLWGLSAEQVAKVESVCIDKIMGDGFKDNEKGNSQDSIEACHRFFAATKTKNADALEYARMAMPNSIEALRAVAIMDPAGNKGELTARLTKWKQEKDGKDKKGEPIKIVTYQGRDEAIVGALALGYGDKVAKEAIDYWLGYDADWKSFNDQNGWEGLFLVGGPFFAVDKNLLAAMEKAFEANKTLVEANGGKEGEMITRGAIGLTQMGSPKGLETLKQILNGTDAGAQKEVLQGLGGITYYWGTSRWGAGGIKVGPGALQKAQVQELIDLILKRMKFLQHKAEGTLAILDMRARVRAAGL